jgi:hypothetical protein
MNMSNAMEMTLHKKNTLGSVALPSRLRNTLNNNLKTFKVISTRRVRNVLFAFIAFVM